MGQISAEYLTRRGYARHTSVFGTNTIEGGNLTEKEMAAAIDLDPSQVHALMKHDLPHAANRPRFIRNNPKGRLPHVSDGRLRPHRRSRFRSLVPKDAEIAVIALKSGQPPIAMPPARPVFARRGHRCRHRL